MKLVLRLGVLLVPALVFAASQAPTNAAETPPKPPRPYGRGDASYHQTVAAPYAFENEIVKISFDVAKGTISAVTTNVVHPVSDGLSTIPFDSVGLQYSAVTVNGAPATFAAENGKLLVHLSQPARAGERLSIVATYTGAPTRGIYFVRPDAQYPHMQPEIWSQGEADDNRRWFPTWDAPNAKSPSELIVTVQKSWSVIANGVLESKTDGADGTTTTFDWVEAHPHSSYLTAF